MKSVISSPGAPAAVGPYSQAVSVDTGAFFTSASAGIAEATLGQSAVRKKILFLSGQVGIDPAAGKMVEGGVEAQTRRIFRNIEAILQEADAGLQNIVKTTIFLSDMSDFATVNTVYGELMPEPYPARSTFAVKGLPLGAAIEIETVAVVQARGMNNKESSDE